MPFVPDVTSNFKILKQEDLCLISSIEPKFRSLNSDTSQKKQQSSFSVMLASKVFTTGNNKLPPIGLEVMVTGSAYLFYL